MQNNEFEKQVQQKMDELKLIPSTEVWDNVEASLPKERKHRWVIFFLLFAATSTATLLWLNNDNPPVKNTSQLPLQKNNIAAIEQKSNDNAQPQLNETKANPSLQTTEPAYNTGIPAPVDNTAKAINEPAVTKTTNNEITGNKKESNKTSAVKTTPEIPLAANTNNRSTITKTNGDEITNNKNENNKTTTVKTTTAVPVAVNASNEKNYREKYLSQPSVLASVAKMKITTLSPGTYEEEKGKPVEENGINEKNKTGIPIIAAATTTKLSNTPEEKDAKKTALTIKDKSDSSKNIAAAEKQNKKKKQAWQYSIQLGVGLPYTKNGINSTVFTANATSSFAAAPVSNVYHQPATPSPGKVFQAGITVEKNITGRLDIKTGLSYTYLSNHIKIGNKVDSLSGNGISTYNNDNNISPGNNGPINSYNNYFRFIQLPLSLQYAVVKKDQFSLFLEGGASLDYMVNSNALLFDGATNTYSTGKRIFNRMVYTGIAGIGAKMAQQAKIPVTVGYQFSYGLKPFFKNADTQQHLPISLVYFRVYLNR